MAEKKIIFMVFSILMALCTLAFMAYRKSQDLLISTEAIEQAEEFRNQILEVRSTLTDLETGVRGYVVTGDESYLTPTNSSIADIYFQLREMESFPKLDSVQQAQINQLRQLTDEKATYLTRIAEIRRHVGMTEAIAFISEGKDYQLMQEIRQLTDGLKDHASVNLAELKTKHRTAIRNFAITFYFLLLKVSITVVTVIVLFILYLRRRNKDERALRESKALFQNVLDHTSAVISIKDLSGRYLLINKAYEKLTGVSRNVARGQTAHDLFEKDAADTIRAQDLEVIRRQEPMKTKESVWNVLGTQHFESLKFPLFDEHHIPYAICSISTDETEKLESDKAHQEQMSRILDLFNNAPCGYQATNKDGIIIEMNETLLKWLGYTREEVIGKMHVRNLVSEESMDQLEYYFPRLRSGELKSAFDIHGFYTRKDGEKISIILNTIAQYDDQGQFLYTRTSIFETSFRKRPEETIAHN